MTRAFKDDFHIHDRDAERVLNAAPQSLAGKSFRGNTRTLDDGRRFVSAWDAAYEIRGDKHQLGFRQLWLWKLSQNG